MGEWPVQLRVLSAEDIHQAITMAQAIAAVQEAFGQLSAGQAVVPLRTPIETNQGVTLVMPGYLRQSEEMAVKIVSVFAGNAARGLPTIMALAVVIDAETGQPLAVMDGAYLTALRTGAASGVATDLLARPDARTVAIFGAGVQGRTQLEAVCQVRDIEWVWVYDVVPEAAQQYATEMRQRGGRIPVEVCVANSPGEAVREADVVCTATTSSTPVFDGQDVTPGTHINGIGAYTPQMQEVPASVVQQAKLVVDSRSGCLAEAGDILIPLRQGLIDESHIHAELGEIINGEKLGRERDNEITFFKSVGNAVQDVAVAACILHRAEEIGLGTLVDL
ncbi:MAG TPA: hypothetical protein EYP04_01700 [Anaerolineae bacterium]|nr:hypothetical protein [Anaerolineae bacterium]HIQ04276.1 hypothetical protein [Anaerolineae bacterium]